MQTCVKFCQNIVSSVTFILHCALITFKNACFVKYCDASFIKMFKFVECSNWFLFGLFLTQKHKLCKFVKFYNTTFFIYFQLTGNFVTFMFQFQNL